MIWSLKRQAWHWYTVQCTDRATFFTSKHPRIQHFRELFLPHSAPDNGNFDWYQEVAGLVMPLLPGSLSLALIPCCADVYKETSPANIKGSKLSPRAVAMEITLLWSPIHVWLIVFFSLLSVQSRLHKRPLHRVISSRKQTVGIFQMHFVSGHKKISFLLQGAFFLLDAPSVVAKAFINCQATSTSCFLIKLCLLSYAIKKSHSNFSGVSQTYLEWEYKRFVFFLCVCLFPC